MIGTYKGSEQSRPEDPSRGMAGGSGCPKHKMGWGRRLETVKGQRMDSCHQPAVWPSTKPKLAPLSERGVGTVGTVTHLDGLHDGFIQIREAGKPEHHAVDQLCQLLQAAGPRVGVLLDQRRHHRGDVREELREQRRVSQHRVPHLACGEPQRWKHQSCLKAARCARLTTAPLTFVGL